MKRSLFYFSLITMLSLLPLGTLLAQSAGSGQTTVVMHEDFSSLAQGGTSEGQQVAWNDANRPATVAAVTNCSQAGRVILVGSRYDGGSITFNPLDLTADEGKFSLQIQVSTYHFMTQKNILYVQVNDQPETVVSVENVDGPDGGFEPALIVPLSGGTDATKIKIYTKNDQGNKGTRVYINDVKVVQKSEVVETPSLSSDPAALDFGLVNVGESKDLPLTVDAAHLSADITVTIEGAQADQFSLVQGATVGATVSIPAVGGAINIRFVPTADKVGAVVAKVILVSGDLRVEVPLSAQSFDPNNPYGLNLDKSVESIEEYFTAHETDWRAISVKGGIKWERVSPDMMTWQYSADAKRAEEASARAILFSPAVNFRDGGTLTFEMSSSEPQGTAHLIVAVVNARGEYVKAGDKDLILLDTVCTAATAANIIKTYAIPRGGAEKGNFIAFIYEGGKGNATVYAIHNVKYVNAEPAMDPELSVGIGTLEFGQIQAETTLDKTVTVTAKNIEGSIEVSISGEGFRVMPRTLPSTGGDIKVTFAPMDKDRKYMGTLTVKAGDLIKLVSLTGASESGIGVCGVVTDEVSIHTEKSLLIIEASKSATVSIYAVDGKMIYNGIVQGVYRANLPSGTYIVVVDGTAKKIVL